MEAAVAASRVMTVVSVHTVLTSPNLGDLAEKNNAA